MLMTKGMPFCSATCAMADALAGVESADQKLGALADQLLGARAGHIHALVSVSAFMICRSGMAQRP